MTVARPADRSTTPTTTRVVSASDPDDEVRAVVRLVIAALRDGVPLERMAVLYGAAEPYARLVHEQLDAAGILHNGAAVRTLAESVLGRGLLGLLALPDRDYQRHDVMRLLASAPVFHRGRAVPGTRWETHQPRRRDRARPRPVAASASSATRARRSSSSPPSARSPIATPTPSISSAQLAATRDLQNFVATLVGDLAVDAGGGLARAGGVGRAARARPPRARGAAGRLARGRTARRRRRSRPRSSRLAGLDAVETAPGVEVFRRTLELELDADLGRVGRLGDGILMGHVALGLGLDLDRVFVCGLAEGLFPARVRDDSLLPDADRRATDGRAPAPRRRASTTTTVACSRRWRVRRASACSCSRAAICAAPPNACRRGSWSRRSARRTHERLPDDLGDLQADWYTPIPSFAAGIARVEFPATAQEHRLRSLLDHARAGRPVAEHELRDVDLALDRGHRDRAWPGRAASSPASTATSPGSTPAA